MPGTDPPVSRLPLQVSDSQLPAVRLADFSRRFAQALPELIRFVLSDALRGHPKWGPLMPYDVPMYGNLPSPGHIARPDIVLTAQGPVVVEIDFSPSGRGWVLASLRQEADQAAFLQVFADWYRSMDATRIQYANGTLDTHKPECDYYAGLLRKMCGVDCTSINVDEDPLVPGSLLDRLFYYAELANPVPDFSGVRVVTAEPWLDSKMIFAVIHDPGMTPLLTQQIGAANLQFLRQVLARTYLLEDVVHGNTDLDLRREVIGLEQLGGAQEGRHRWAIKSTDVETAWCWGGRGVVLGVKYTRAKWRDAVCHGISPTNKTIGPRPVLQQFAPSRNFVEIWDAAASGHLVFPDPTLLGRGRDDIITRPSLRPVHARLGLYFLVSHTTGETFTVPTGSLTLRQHPLAHGASDAMPGAFTPV